MDTTWPSESHPVVEKALVEFQDAPATSIPTAQQPFRFIPIFSRHPLLSCSYFSLSLPPSLSLCVHFCLLKSSSKYPCMRWFRAYGSKHSDDSYSRSETITLESILVEQIWVEWEESLLHKRIMSFFGSSLNFATVFSLGMILSSWICFLLLFMTWWSGDECHRQCGSMQECLCSFWHSTILLYRCIWLTNHLSSNSILKSVQIGMPNCIQLCIWWCQQHLHVYRSQLSDKLLHWWYLNSNGYSASFVFLCKDYCVWSGL